MSALTYQSRLYPGQRINILAGVAVTGSSVFNHPLSDGFKDPIDQLLATTDPAACVFGPFPVLVPCSNWTALVDAFFARYTFDGQPSSFAGAAALQAHSPAADANRAAIAARLGIRVEDADDRADRSFILVRIPRRLPHDTVCLTSSHYQPLWQTVLADCRRAIEGLQAGAPLADAIGMTSPDAVRNVLDLVENQLGSHIVASVSIGDEAFQVFVYTREQFARVRGAMDQSGWQDAKAFSFRYFTAPNFVLYSTPPALVSNAPEFSAVLPLLEDAGYGVKASVFNVLLNEKALQKCDAICSVACVGAGCVSVTTEKAAAPVSLLAAQEAPLAAPAGALIDTVAMQSAITRFGAAGCGPAAVTGDAAIPYASLYKPFAAHVPIAMLWSPYVSLVQPYVQLGDFWNSAAVDKSAVKHLAVVADVIEIEDSIDLSTVQTVAFTCRVLIAGKDGKVPTVTLSPAAWDPLQLYCGSMSGTCAFEVAGKPECRRLVFDHNAISLTPDAQQVVYDDFFAGRYPVKVFADSSTAPEVAWRKSAFQSGLEALLLTDAAVLRPQAILSPDLAQTAVEAWKCLQWIGDYLQEVVSAFTAAGRLPPEEIASLYSLSVTLTRAVYDPRLPKVQLVPQVPSLRYTAYEKAVTRLLDTARIYAAQIDKANQDLLAFSLDLQNQYRADRRDDALRKLGQFMVAQNRAFAEHEDDLTDSHNEIISHNKENVGTLTRRMHDIEKQYEEYVSKLNAAKQALVDAIEAEKTRQEIQLVCEFVFGLAEALTNIATGVYGFKALGDAKDVERVLKQLEAFLKFMEAINKLIESGEKLAERIGNVQALSNSTPNSFVRPPTDADWEIFMHDSEAQVRPAEEFVKAEVENFIAAVRNVTSIARALNAVQEQIAQLNYNVFTEESSRRVSKQQAARLRALELNLGQAKSPSRDYIADLGQYAAVLQQRQNSILNKLAEIAMLQDDSMTYHYLSQPSLITQFDLAAIQESLAHQALSAVQMLATYPYPPTDALQPVVVKVEYVSTAALMSDAGVTIDVAPTFKGFNSMARVRINSVDVRVDGVVTDGGQCHVQMVSGGMPMFDRGLKRELLTYKMVSREWHVVYDIASDTTVIGTQPGKDWDTFFTKPTPFQTWRITLPKTPENAGLRFTAPTATVTLRFNVEMMYSAPPEAARKLTGPQLLAAGAVPDPTGFVQALQGTSITDGWDVVSFVSVDRINELWLQRWQAETKAAFQGEPTFVQNIDITYSQALPGNVQVDYHLEAKAGPPRLTFVPDGMQSELVDIPLINGKLTTTTYVKGTCVGEDTAAIQSTAAQPVMVRTRAPMQALPGEVDGSHAVHINPAEGVFALENITLDPLVDANFCAQMAEYFKKQKLQPWLVGSLRFAAQQDFLQPKTFSFRTFNPPEERAKTWPAILGIYVLTTTASAPGHGMRQHWPDTAWPVSSYFDGAVYFSADLLWRHEVLPAMTAAHLPDAAIRIDEHTHEYSASFVSIPVFNQAVPMKVGWEDQNMRWASPPPYASVSIPASWISLKFDLHELKLSSPADTWKESFPYPNRHPHASRDDASVSVDIGWDDVKVSCAFESVTRPKIDPDTFEVTFDPLTVSPTVALTSPVHKLFGIPILAQIPKQVVEDARKVLQGKFSGLQINLGSMSMFAVSNLLFPESKTLEPCGVYFPHDMMIIGQVTRTWTPPAPK